MKKKSLIWGAALLAGVVSSVTVDAQASFAKTSADFTDLKDLDAALKAKIDALLSAGVFDGVSDTSFGLKEEMNRAQFAKVAAQIMGLDVQQDLKTSSFSDVKADDAANGYALPYIEAIKTAGITNGVGAGEFDPAGQVTKEQLAAFLVRALGKDTDTQADTPAQSKSDPTVSDWAKRYVAVAVDLKLLSNGPGGNFGGNSNATRDLLVTGAFETRAEYAKSNPLVVSEAEFAEGNKLNLKLSEKIDAKSVDLSKITVNGQPLDPQKDRYEVSADGKTVIVTLHEGFTLDTSKAPTVKVEGLKTPFGNEVKNDAAHPLPVIVTAALKAPVILPSPVRQPTTAAPQDPPVMPSMPTPSDPQPSTPIDSPAPSDPGPSTPSDPPTPSDPQPSTPIDSPTPSDPGPSTPIDLPTPGDSDPSIPIDLPPSNPEPSTPIDPPSPSSPNSSNPSDPVNLPPTTPMPPLPSYPMPWIPVIPLPQIPVIPTPPVPGTPIVPNEPLEP